MWHGLLGLPQTDAGVRLTDLIDDPIKGIEECNLQINKLKMYQAMLEGKLKETDGDPELIAQITRISGFLEKWEELLQKWTHQKYQQGLAQTDVATASKKKRYNASG